MNIKA